MFETCVAEHLRMCVLRWWCWSKKKKLKYRQETADVCMCVCACVMESLQTCITETIAEEYITSLSSVINRFASTQLATLICSQICCSVCVRVCVCVSVCVYGRENHTQRGVFVAQDAQRDTFGMLEISVCFLRGYFCGMLLRSEAWTGCKSQRENSGALRDRCRKNSI